ncbi:MAG: hypothetical protein FRX49_08173 [Trebouxia sp. A1-2]|nr:MAG: hypothetical protein FRX49_08173 [Trebouxia sp. A1-2]
MSDFNPDVEFLGLRVPAGKPLAIPKFVPEDDQTGITHRPHITGVALGPKPKPGRHTVFAHGNGMEAVFQVDLVARDITFSHNGTSDIYLSGYNTTSAAYFDDMSEEDDDEESEEDEDVPEGVPMQRHKPLPSQDDDEEEEEEGEDDEEEADGNLGLSDDEDEDDSSEDEEEEAQQGLAEALLAAGGKRAKPPAVTPQPAKKAKVASAVTPATAPTSKPQPTTTAALPGLTGPLAAQWLSALKTHLTQSGGETDLSKLGSVECQRTTAAQAWEHISDTMRLLW